MGLDPWLPDVWDVRGLPLGDTHRHQRVSWVDWKEVEPRWLRELAKRWARHRLLTGTRSPDTIHAAAGQLRCFSRFLAEHRIDLPAPGALTRPVLERFRAHVLDLALSASSQRLILGGLNTLIDDARKSLARPLAAVHAERSKTCSSFL